MTTHNIFTDDLIEDILLRLPVEHLLRLRCVCKSWCALIDSTNFIKKHHQVQSTVSREEGNAPLFLTRRSLHNNVSEFYLLSKNLGDNILCLTHLVRDRVFNDDPNHYSRLCCMGVVNGVVGLCWGDEFLSLGLWNPATGEFKVIPPPRPSDSETSFEFGVDILGLGFNPKSSDFKIVRSMLWNLNVEEDEFDDPDYICEMYSLSTNSWTRLELPRPLPPHRRLRVNFPRTDGYNNGVYYWSATEFDGDGFPPRYVILSFDFSTEAFKSFDAPPSVVKAAANNVYNFDWMVGLYMERLALIFRRQNSREALFSFEIWVASEFDVGDGSEIALSWQHLFTIEPPNDYIYAKKFVAFRMDDGVLFNGRKGCSLYNPSTRTFENLELSFHRGYRYVESLFPLSKRQNQSYKELNKLKKRKRKQVLEGIENKYDESGDFASPSQTQDDAYSTPIASHYTDDSFSGTHTHNCSCCLELGAVKQQLDELNTIKQQLDELGAIKQQLVNMKKAIVSLARGEPIPAWLLTESSNPPSQLPPLSP